MQHADAKHEAAGERLDPLSIEVWLPHSPNSDWHVLRLRGTEAISSPYEFKLELFSDDPSVDHDELIGADCEILLDRNGTARTLYGIIAAVELSMSSDPRTPRGGSLVRVRVVPALRMLEQVVDTRFFAGQTVPQILCEVLTPALADYGRQIDCESRLEGTYNPRDYCVQFRESTLAFCSRIMEEEGIAYVFVPDHEQQREELVLIDNNEHFQAVELLVHGAVPLVLSQPEEHDRESIQTFDWRNTRTPNRVITRGYNMKCPRPLDEGHAERLDVQRHVVRALHLDGDTRQIIDDPVNDPDAKSFTGCELPQRGPLATRVLERHTLESADGRGRSNVVGFAAGCTFELGEHPAPGLAQRKYLLVEVTHEAEEDGDRQGSGYVYTNAFECAPYEHTYRPAPRTPRPRVYGVQTGVVVGRINEEIYTDQFGRVRVRFHRDHHEIDDEHASCWIPLAQSWAGPGYGAMVIPRVGMEVVVSFVDGNPDCPIVTGCVYNGANMPSYAPASEPTTTSFKTCSSPGGDGFNELRFEDAHGSEQVFVHAQRRMDLHVRGSLYETTGGNREQRVGGEHHGDRHGDHNTLVHKDVNHHIMEARYTKVGEAQYTSVGEDLIEDFHGQHVVLVGETSQLSAPRVVVEASEYVSHKADELELAGSSTISVKGGDKVVIESNNAIELKVGASFVSITPEGVDIQGLMVRLNSGGGTGSAATEGIPALAVDLLEPLDALAADDGRPGPAGAGARGASARVRERRTLEPHHAPPMKPPPPIQPGSPAVLPDGSVARRFLHIAWVESEAYCSERPALRVIARYYDPGDTELLSLTNATDGAVQRSFILRPGEGEREHPVDILDILPRQTMAGVEKERSLLASAGGLTTLVPLDLQFLTTIAQTWYENDSGARFYFSVENSEVIIGGTIDYVRGWLHEIIMLADTVPKDTGGLIGGRLDGSKDWRYCKKGDDDERLYWDGKKWLPVPKTWVETEQSIRGVAVWAEGDTTKTRYGTLPWPDPPMVWDDFPAEDTQKTIENYNQPAVEKCWSGRFDIKRQGCRSHDPRCCRYGVRCRVRFRETDVLRGGAIVLHLNHARSNSETWPFWPDVEDEHPTWAHEFGHHLGNPDEYEGAVTVDPGVNGDGAVAGIDEQSIMGNGSIVRRRHYQTICEALGEMVARQTGRNFTYTPVPVLQP